MREALRGLSRLNDISCMTISTLPLQMALHVTLYYFREVICEWMALQRPVEQTHNN